MSVLQQQFIYVLVGASGEFVAVLDNLFGIELYAHYVIVIERFEDGQVEGTLMTQPFEIAGPFADFIEARIMAESLQ